MTKVSEIMIRLTEVLKMQVYLQKLNEKLSLKLRIEKEKEIPKNGNDKK